MERDKLSPKINQTSIVHQILITDDLSPSRNLPEALDANRKELSLLYPKAEYKLWLKEEIREFLGVSFDASVLSAFDVLRPYAFKADLARYCLLHAKGGLYVDLGVRLMRAWDVPEDFGFAAFKELNFTSACWAIVQNGLIWSRAGRPELEIAIRWIVENCGRHYYGQGSLYPTGPVLFGRAIVAAMAAGGQKDEADDQWIGEYRWVTPDGAMKNDAYVAPDHSVVALRTKAIPGDLKHMGLLGTNNYRALWARRQMYGEKKKVWAHTDEGIQCKAGKAGPAGIFVFVGTIGHVTFGPYVDLVPGRYQLRVIFGDAPLSGRLLVDVVAKAGEQVLARTERTFATSDRFRFLELEFSVSTYVRNVEFRTEAFGNFEGAIAKFELTQMAKETRRWAGSDPAISLLQGQRIGDRIKIGPDIRGRVLHGPYEVIEPGLYELKIVIATPTLCTRLRVELCASRGNKYLHVYEAGGSAPCDEISFTFEIENEYDDFEFRLEVLDAFSGIIEAVELRSLERGNPKCSDGLMIK